ncbi:MAG: hypothetical protein ACYCRH_10270, partial [Acidiferrobacteraceae bacterium]
EAFDRARYRASITVPAGRSAILTRRTGIRQDCLDPHRTLKSLNRRANERRDIPIRKAGARGIEFARGTRACQAYRPLFVEVQLIFGCMVAKRVWFREEANKGAVPVTPKLSVWFRPVRYAKSCSFDEIDSGAEASDYPMAVNRKSFVPDVVRIDNRAGKWVGDFTYLLDVLHAQNTSLKQTSLG